MIQPETFAENTLRLLQQDPRRYLNFGVFWFFVKALLKRYYTRDNLHILGEYMDPECMARMPEFATIQEAMQAALEEYGQNARYNMGRQEVEDPVGGGLFMLNDEDFA